MRCATAGCPPGGPTTVASVAGGISVVAIDNAAVYWASAGRGGTTPSIMKLAK